MKRLMILILLMFTGCASLPVLEVSQKAGTDASRFYYDTDSKIAYSVNYDDDNLYIVFKTDNENAIRKMFRDGLYIYVDPNGRKSKNIYFQYPLSGKMGGGMPGMRQMPINGQRPMNGQMSMNGQMQNNMKKEFNVNEFIDNADMEAIFSYRELAEKLPVYSQKTDIKVALTAPVTGELLYELRIPFDRIETKVSTEFAIGIVSGEMKMPEMGGGPQGGFPQGGGLQGGPGAGMQDGSEGSGGPGGGMNRNDNMQDIDIWFKIVTDRGYTEK